MADFEISQLAVPTAVFLIIFLAYSAQTLLPFLDPGPLTGWQTVKFNTLVLCLWICYARSCSVNPGAKSIQPTTSQTKYCRKCEAPKPPRAHHCRTCGRCIPKMDHHCPWTNNCVSYFTFPHFIRFVFYATAAMTYLEYFLYIRVSVLWENRHLPSYLGPSGLQMAHLLSLVAVNSVTLIALAILLLRTLYGLATNVTTIEGWEIARHERLVRRARALGGFLDGPDGIKIRVEKQEFPYDIGIWQNIRQGFGGSSNVLSWFWPLAATPPAETGFRFETNGFEDESKLWPPPDPDRIPRVPKPVSNPFNFDLEDISVPDRIAAFRERQNADLRRRQGLDNVRHRSPFSKRLQQKRAQSQLAEDEELDDWSSQESGEEGWRSPDGERLKDFGVDEEIEFYDG